MAAGQEDELQHADLGPFVSGPLDVGGVRHQASHATHGRPLLRGPAVPAAPRTLRRMRPAGASRAVSDVTWQAKGPGHSFFPHGYGPPSIGSRHKPRNLPSGAYSGGMAEGKPAGFGLALWYACLNPPLACVTAV